MTLALFGPEWAGEARHYGNVGDIWHILVSFISVSVLMNS